MSEEKKKRGRPPLPPEEKERRRIAKNVTVAAYHKSTGYAAQKKYRQSHAEKYRDYHKASQGKIYEPKIRIPVEHKEALLKLLERENTSLTQLFISLVYEKYNLNLRSK